MSTHGNLYLVEDILWRTIRILNFYPVGGGAKWYITKKTFQSLNFYIKVLFIITNYSFLQLSEEAHQWH